MEATSTIDMRPATSSEMRAYNRHVEHDPEETHANKMIVESDRELNRYHVINDEKIALNDQYQNYLDIRNDKLENDFEKNKISLEQYTSRKQTVQEYVNGSNGSKEKKAYTSAVLTVADVDTQRDMLDRLGWSYKMIGVGKQDKNGKYETYRAQLTDKSQREQWARLWDMTYTQTAKDISNESLRVISVATNLDEGGGAHAHVGFVNMGHTDKGKPSTTMNSALKAMYGYKDSRANLKQFRGAYDSIMIANFNDAAQALNLDLHLDMIRTREAGSVDMPTYKMNKKKEAELKQREEQVKKDSKINEDDALKNAIRTTELQELGDELEEQKAEQQKQQNRLKLQQREQLEAKRAIVDVIKTYDENHKVRKLEDAEEISTETGYQQHLEQSTSYLTNVLKRTLKRVAVTALKFASRANEIVERRELELLKSQSKQFEEKTKQQKKQVDDDLEL